MISLTADLVDSPMYAVINNSMGSGSVTYECEGNETRLSDCVSPLSSTIAPCYYALVKCTTDKKSGGSTTTAGIVAVVVVSLLAVLQVVTIVILVVWLKRRAKNLKPADNTATTSPQSPTYAAVTGGIGALNETLELSNPNYQPTQIQPKQTLEYKFDNPLYSTVTKAGLSES